MTAEDVLLTPERACAILHMVGIRCTPSVTPIKRYNHVYHVVCGTDEFFLKTYTKAWYGGDTAATGGCVDHEASAWRTLAQHGLAVPQVVLAAENGNNPFQRPFLLTTQLPGRPLTDLLAWAEPAQFTQLLRAVGRYLRHMHAITFEFPGYITSHGPHAAPDPSQWRHALWVAEEFKAWASRVWSEDWATVPTVLLNRVHDFWRQHEQALERAYRPPRFAHGDCHAHQFFLAQEDDQWHVSGVLDMEVASAGDCEADFVKLGLELAGMFPARTRWWQPLFEGYGKEPDFALMQLRLLAAHHINYTCLGEHSWPGTRAQIVAHVLDAERWEQLFDVQSIV
jgi:aminoglycoside phosphotransferase